MADTDQPALTEADLVKLDGMVQEAVQSKVRTASEKDLQKEIAERAKDEVSIEKKQFNWIVAEKYEDKISEEIEEKESVINLVESMDSAVDKNDKS